MIYEQMIRYLGKDFYRYTWRHTCLLPDINLSILQRVVAKNLRKVSDLN